MREILTSHSIDNLFDYCPRKFEFLGLFDKRPPRESGFAADVGTALHEGAQEFVRLKAEGHDDTTAMNQGYITFMTWYPWDREDEQKQSTRSHDRALLLLYQLMRWEGWDDWELVKIEGKGWAIEVPFLIRHKSLGTFTIKETGEEAMLCTQGKIDFILRHKKTNRIGSLDIKTTVFADELIEPNFKFSGQQIGYNNVVQSLTGEVTDGLEVNYLVARFTATGLPEVYPLNFHKRQDEVDDYWIAKLDRLQRMRMYAEAGWFPRTSGGCHSYGTACSMFGICPSRDYRLIRQWFNTGDMVENVGYDYWVELDQ